MGFEHKFLKGLLVVALLAVISHIGSSSVVRQDEGEYDKKLSKRSADFGEFDDEDDSEGDTTVNITKRSADVGEEDTSGDDEEGTSGRRKRSSSYQNVKVYVLTGKRVNRISKRFSSIAVGARSFLQISRSGFNVNSTRMQNLAKAISPAAVRCGGSYANFLIYKPDGVVDPIPDETVEAWESLFQADFHSEGVGRKNWKNFNVTATRWFQMLKFFKDVKWDFLFNFNQLLTKDGHWDGANAELMLKDSIKNNLRIWGLSLANEPNSQGYKYDKPAVWNWNTTLGVYKTFHEFIENDPELKEVYQRLQVVGPEPTSLARHWGAFTFLQQFFATKETNGIIDRMALHHYYLNGKDSHLTQYLDPATMEQLKLLWERADFVRKNCSRKSMQVWLTETASAYGGGKKGVTDAFADIFMYADLLAYGAQLGFAQINRQNFRSAYYSLIDWDDNPNPSYYISVLHKRLILGNVYNVSMNPTNNRTRIYASCARTDVYDYPDGAITFVAINVLNETVMLDFRNTTFKASEKEVFLLERDRAMSWDKGMTSKRMFLNGKLIDMPAGVKEVPELKSQTKRDRVPLPDNSVAFIVVKNAAVQACHGG